MGSIFRLAKRTKKQRCNFPINLFLESLEPRNVPAIFNVTGTSDSFPIPLPTPEASPDTFSVGSLRGAIIAANSLPNANHTINLPAGTYNLSLSNSGLQQENFSLTGDLDLTQTGCVYQINGQGGQAIIQQTVQDRVLQLFENVGLVLQNISVQGGSAVDNGNEGVLPATTDALGGGILCNVPIHNFGAAITLNSSTVENNKAITSNGFNAQGGGIYLSVGNTNFPNSNNPPARGIFVNLSSISNNQTVAGNGLTGNGGGFAQGGGIYIENGNITIQSTEANASMINGNLAQGGFGGNGLEDFFLASGLYIPAGSGGIGGVAQGGGIFLQQGNLIFNGNNISLNNNTSQGGNGGAGGNASNGNAGNGGDAGDGRGAAVFINIGSINLSDSTSPSNPLSISGNAALGGIGGVGGNSTTGIGGQGGDGGSTWGGAFYLGVVAANFNKFSFSENKAIGGMGGNGGDSSMQNSGIVIAPGTGGQGGASQGGAIFGQGLFVILSPTAVVAITGTTAPIIQDENSTFANNFAQGGVGGSGGNALGNGQVGGQAGSGGFAQGGAIAIDPSESSLTLNQTTIQGNVAMGGSDGTGGGGGPNGGKGGLGGSSSSGGAHAALGGGIFSNGTVNITGATIVSNIARGGSGGNGGPGGDNASTTGGTGGDGGFGGPAEGGGLAGGLRSEGTKNGGGFTFYFSSIKGNQALGGVGGNGGPGGNSSQIGLQGIKGNGGSGGGANGGGIETLTGPMGPNEFSTSNGINFNSGAITKNSGVSGNGGNGNKGGAPGSALGGGISSGNGPSVLINSTVSNNEAEIGQWGSGTKGSSNSPSFGGGVYLNKDSLTISNSTIAFNTANSGGGISNQSNKSFTLFSSIVANNQGVSGPDILDSVTANYSLIGEISGSIITGSNNLPPQNPQLNTLANKGGPTETCSLMVNSPVLGQGMNMNPPFQYDQRGVGYPRSTFGLVDIGAFQLQNSTAAVGTDFGTESRARVILSNNQTRFETLPFSPEFTGGVRVAMGDINNDGANDLIVGAGPGGGPHVKVIDGATGMIVNGPLGSFFSFSPNFTGGVYLAAIDLNRDGNLDILTGAGQGGGPHVKVFSGANGSLLASFHAFSSAFLGGVTVASGDVNGDGFQDILAGAGPGGGPEVRVFSGNNLSLIHSFFAFDPGFRGGVFVAAGDFDGNGFADLITGAGAGGGPNLRVFQGNTFLQIWDVMVFSSVFRGGCRVGTADLFGDGVPEILVAPGPGGAPHLSVFDNLDSKARDEFFVFDREITSGLFPG